MRPPLDGRSVTALVATLARREAPNEATIQADVRQLLLSADINLGDEDLGWVVLESPAGNQLRIDVEVGATLIEVKKDLRSKRARDKALPQLQRYVHDRQEQHGTRYVGILTDGALWTCYQLERGALAPVSEFSLSESHPDAGGLIAWLEGVLATTRNLRPLPDQIRLRLGTGSSAHALDRATIAALYHQHKDLPTVRTKRRLWARLLQTALGTQFEDRDALFIEHTLLVASADIIAHAVLGLPVETLEPRSLLSGEHFDQSGIFGVVEADFFDWIGDVPDGAPFVRALARRLARFDWSAVEHDVLKALYESVITPATRKKLGEYYTPDWLAQAVVDDVVRDPFGQRVLDAACGSGTFVFHAVRRYLASAEAKGLTPQAMLEGVTEHVIGMDLHPVAVTLARVTYLLAIGRKRIQEERGDIQVPIYLGDSMRWRRQATDLWSAREFTILADEDPGLFKDDKFTFPSSLLQDTRRFDQLVKALADKASSGTRKRGAPPEPIGGILERLNVPEEMHEQLTKTLGTMCRLHDEGRDHIWGYYIRNQARPEWLARPENRVDVLIGNPPWLAYRFMPPDMKREFRALMTAHGLWQGGAKVATHQDLSGLFAVRMVAQYLKPEGRFGFVMPSSALDAAQFDGFQTGRYDNSDGEIRVSFGKPWDLRRVRPHFFPRASAVVFGSRSAAATALPATRQLWQGKLPRTDATWAEVHGALERKDGMAAEQPSERSSYHSAFRQGANIVPRVLFMVDAQRAGPLGQVKGRLAVHSATSAYEKDPWKSLPRADGVVEKEFVRPVYLGECVLPYRTLAPVTAVMPVDKVGLLDSRTDRFDRYPGFADWWRRAEQCWEASKSAGSKLTLLEQVDYQGKLSAQLPLRTRRVVYTASGMHVSAALLIDKQALVEHQLYWAEVTSEAEGRYLCAILNAATTTMLVRPFMSYGKDERHIDKHVWKLPIPSFDPNNEKHVKLALLSERAEAEVGRLDLADKHFATLRGAIRRYLAATETGRAIESLVSELLSST